MYVLCMNDMRHPKFEELVPVARAETKEELQALIEKHTAPEPWYDEGPNAYSITHKYGKCFKAGPLEWYNLSTALIQNAGSEDEWAADARESFRENVLSIPTASSLDG